MIHLTADDKTLLKDLSVFHDPVEISDANGKLLGLFVPANLERGKQLHAEAAEGIDWEEINCRAASPGKGKTTREVFEYLLTLTPDAEGQALLREKIERLKERDGCPSP